MPAVPWRDAVAIASGCAPALPAEVVALRDSIGRVLAEPVHARARVPGFTTAAMDGWAVCGAGPWHVLGEVMAGGTPWHERLTPGQAVEIMTGAPVPRGATAVLPYERAAVAGVTSGVVSGELGQRTHIRLAGEDFERGDRLVDAGRAITPAVGGLLAQGSVDEVAVHRRPRVRLLVTGDEVVPAGVPAAGEVRDVFGPMVTALVAANGAIVTDHAILRDDPAVLADSLLAPDADVVAVSGSSSAGRADHLRQVLQTMGARMVVDQVACRPGHPQVLASLPGGRWLVGLPGNPFAGLVAAMTLLQPLLRSMTGLVHQPGRTAIRLPVIGDADITPGITRLVPVILEGDHAVVVPGSRPASLAGAATGDALAVLEHGWSTGTAADLLPLPGLWLPLPGLWR